MNNLVGRVLAFSFACLCVSPLAWCRSAKAYDFNSAFRPFLSMETLEECGAYKAGDMNAVCARGKEHLYLLFGEEKMVLKVDVHGTVVKKLQIANGQGPGEMLTPASLSLHGEELVVLDTQRNKLFFFSTNLDYLRETGLPAGVERICSAGDERWLALRDGGFRAQYDGDGLAFSFLDKAFVKTKGFGVFHEQVPFSGVWPCNLKKGYLSAHSAALACWVFYNDACRAVVYPLDHVDAPVELKWKNAFHVTQADVDKRTHVYECRWVAQKGHKYLVFMSMHKVLKVNGPHDDEMLVFSNRGVLEHRAVVPFSVIPVFSVEQDFPLLVAHDEGIWMEL